MDMRFYLLDTASRKIILSANKKEDLEFLMERYRRMGRFCHISIMTLVLVDIEEGKTNEVKNG